MIKKILFISATWAGLWMGGGNGLASSIKLDQDEENVRQKIVLEKVSRPILQKLSVQDNSVLKFDTLFSQHLHSVFENHAFEPITFTDGEKIGFQDFTIASAYAKYNGFMAEIISIMYPFRSFIQEHPTYKNYLKDADPIQRENFTPSENARLLKRAQFDFCLKKGNFRLFDEVFNAFNQAEALRGHVLQYLASHQDYKDRNRSFKEAFKTALEAFENSSSQGTSTSSPQRTRESDSPSPSVSTGLEYWGNRLVFKSDADVKHFRNVGAPLTRENINRLAQILKENHLPHRDEDVQNYPFLQPVYFTYHPTAETLKELIEDKRRGVRDLSFSSNFLVTEKIAQVFELLKQDRFKGNLVTLDLRNATMAKDVYEAYLQSADQNFRVILSKKLIKEILPPNETEVRVTLSKLQENAKQGKTLEIEKADSLRIDGNGFQSFKEGEEIKTFFSQTFGAVKGTDRVTELHFDVAAFMEINESGYFKDYAFPPKDLFPQLQTVTVSNLGHGGNEQKFIAAMQKAYPFLDTASILRANPDDSWENVIYVSKKR